MDQADIADKDIQDFLDRAIAAARGIRIPQAPVIENEIYCRDCGEEISPGRIEAIAGCKQCIDCARVYEKQEKGFGRTRTSDTRYAEMDDSLNALEL